MKTKITKVLLLASVALSLGAASAQQFIISPSSEITPTEKGLRMRVLRLEQAVEELQEKVFELQHDKKVTKADDIPPQRKWFCEIASFGDRFSSYGQTELETKQAVIKQCSEKFGTEFNCKKISCQLNK